jgi:hypothetical protein
MPLTRITSNVIQDGTIIDADISPLAAIAPSKLGAGQFEKNVYWAFRTDGISGSGTEIDPYDVSNRQKFDEVKGNRTKCPVGCNIYIGEGTFETYGVHADHPSYTSFPLNSNIYGAGMGKTIIKVVGIPNGSGAFLPLSWYAAIIGWEDTCTESIMVSDITLDGNFQNFVYGVPPNPAIPWDGDTKRDGVNINTTGLQTNAYRVHVKNCGGNNYTGKESFGIFAYLEGQNQIGVFDTCFYTDPVKSKTWPGAVNNEKLSYCSGIGFFGGGDPTIKPTTYSNAPTGIIRNCVAIYPILSNDYWGNGGGAFGHGNMKEAIMENCYCRNNMAYQDTGWGNIYHIKNNYFKWDNPTQLTQSWFTPTQIFFNFTLDNGNPVGKSRGWEDVRVDNNLFELPWIPANNIRPNTTTPDFPPYVYITKTKNFTFTNNSVIITNNEGTASGLGNLWIGGEMGTVNIYNNKFNWKVGGPGGSYSAKSDCKYFYGRGNLDQNNVPLYEWEWGMSYIDVKPTLDTDQLNGLILRRAMQFLSSALPSNVPTPFPRPLNFSFSPVIYLYEGTYDLSPITDTSTYGSVGTNVMFNSNCGIIGIGDPSKIILYNTNNESVLYSQIGNVYLKNFTINKGSGDNGCFGLPSAAPTSFENIIFNFSSNQGTLGFFGNIEAQKCVFKGILGQSAFQNNSKFKDCDFINIGSNPLGGQDNLEFINCTVKNFTGRFGTNENGLIKNCLLEGGTGGYIGTGNNSTIENTRIQNSFWRVEGNGCKGYNLIIIAPSGEDSIRSNDTNRNVQCANISANTNVRTSNTPNFGQVTMVPLPFTF